MVRIPGRVFRGLSGLLCLSLLPACGGGGGGGAAPAPPFNTGTGFDEAVTTIARALDGSGDVYVGGDFAGYNGTPAHRIARLNRDGSRDPGFAVVPGFSGLVSGIVPVSDGSGDLLAGGGFTGLHGNAALYLARVTPNGLQAAVDFGTGFDSSVRSLAPAVDGSGDLYAGGFFSTFRAAARERVARVNPDGSNDAGFDTGSGFDDPGLVYAIAAATDGSGDLYAGGLFATFRGNPRDCIVRINSDGSNDGGFDPGTGFDGSVDALATAKDGSNDLYAGGSFDVFRGTNTPGIVRINPDGSFDAGFSTGASFNAIVRTLAVADDGSGDVYVGGDFSSYDGTPASKIVRLNSDGSLDAGFATAAGFGVGIVLVITPAGDGSGDILVGGTFEQYQGTPAGRIVRLHPDGSRE